MESSCPVIWTTISNVSTVGRAMIPGTGRSGDVVEEGRSVRAIDVEGKRKGVRNLLSLSLLYQRLGLVAQGTRHHLFVSVCVSTPIYAAACQPMSSSSWQVSHTDVAK